MATITAFTSEFPQAMAEAISEKPHKIFLYLEYSSGSVPNYQNPAQVPNFSNPKVYYSSLIGANYLRVPAIKDPNVQLNNSSPYSATVNFFGQSSSTSTGVNEDGPTFGNGVNCYGAALVLAPSEQDKTQDLIVARAYFNPPLVKTDSSELFVTFPFSTSITGY
jgi:hypothetical protein